MKRNTRRFLIGILLPIWALSCDRIPPNEYWVPMPEEEWTGPVSRVLVEEYTGQRCINCPEAAALLQKQKSVLKDNLLIVSMHAPRTGMTEPGLAAAEADLYAVSYGHERSVPGVMVNREPLGSGARYSQSPSLWASEIWERAMRPAVCRLDRPEVEMDPVKRTIRLAVRAEAPEKGADGYGIQLWMVEDVLAGQSLPQGVSDHYFHHNVFRGSLNGTWGQEYEMGTTYHAEAVIPPSVTILENSKVLVYIFNARTFEILDAVLCPLGKGISPEEGEDPDLHPQDPEGESETLYFHVGGENIWSGAEITSESGVLMDAASGMVSMDSPLVYILPGQKWGEGTYGFSVSKMDHRNNPDCGLMMVCVDGKCMPALSAESYEGQVEVTADQLETRQAFSIHYFVRGEASLKKDAFKIRVAFTRSGQEVASVVLDFDYDPARFRPAATSGRF